MMPLAYKYLYSGDLGTKEGPLKSGTMITSYIYHLIKYFLKLKKLNIEPYVCIDQHSFHQNDLKSDLVMQRKQNREKICALYEEKIKNDTMTSTDWFKYNCAKTTLFSDKTELSVLKKILACMNIKVFQYKGLEAESFCAFLKKNNYVDYCYSTDKDITLYGVDALISLNPETGHYLKYDHEKNMKDLNLTEFDNFLDCVIASGTDYSKGLFKVGPKNALKKFFTNKNLLKEELYDALGKQKVEAIRDLFKMNFESEKIEKILNYIDTVISVKTTDLEELKKTLEEIDFSNKYVNSILEYLKVQTI